ncbi:splicing factor 3A subunit 3 [Kwoniella heveanensis BCC8398]|uniref:Splicing factor 3A subunit 3 n=1 Tax=Kwoniella heveanensis BCC8398 TaxID=1296120 RepID=A0A1B9GKV7_9TREE|nr:splicing factor 3A subunit 3 [Kwoniella heveanensis BCC8398]
MDSIIETQRQTHEEIERYEQALADVLGQNPTVRKNITRRDRKAAEILDRVGTLRKELVDLYEDIPGLRPRELELLSAPPAGQDDLAEFYTRYNKIKSFHQRNPGISSRQFVNELDDLVKGDGVQSIQVDGDAEPTILDPLDAVFTSNEAYGKFLDVTLPHSQYLNLRGATRLSYIAFVELLKQGKVERNLDLKEKSQAGYLEYVQTLYNYLLSFFERALPLVNVQAKIKEEEEKFQAAWEAGQVPGWEAASSSKSQAQTANGEGIWCKYCQKNYSKQTVYDAHLKSEKHKKKEREGKAVSDPSQANGSPAPAASSSNSSQRNKLQAPAKLTFLVTALLTFPPIPALLADTRTEVERKMALTAREREAELQESEEQAAAPPVDLEAMDEEEDDGKIYNPLKLPLGWDGKPIPVWLWKLHGLGVSFDCEICQSTYQGRKVFDKHFSESKHAFGLRALGVPPGRHWFGLTKINDVLALAEKLKREGRAELADMDRAEEFEDDEGHVYDRKTWQDLKKQGLI